MKNGIIALLAITICVLVFRDLRPVDSTKPDRQSRNPRPSAEKVLAGVAADSTKAPAKHKVAADLPRPLSGVPSTALQPPIPDNMRAIARAEIQKQNALLYARYFAKAHLGSRKADLLMELLTDRMMAGLEPDVQPGDGTQSPYEKNDQMIVELIGSDGFAELEASKASYLADRAAQDVIDAVFGQQTISEDRRSAIADAVRDYNPSAGFGDLIANKATVTPEMEADLRNAYAKRLSQTMSGLERELNESEMNAFRAWSDAQFEKSLGFLRIVTASNGKK